MTNDANAITPAGEALNTAARNVASTNRQILYEIEGLRGVLERVERYIREGFSLDPVGIPELDRWIVQRGVQIEAQKNLRYALGEKV